MKLRLKILLLLLVVKQVRGKGWDTLHVAPKLAFFLTVHVRDNTEVTALPSPQVRVVQERDPHLRLRLPLCTRVLGCRCSHSCGSPSVPFFALQNPSYGTELRRGLALESLLSMEILAANETGGTEGMQWG